eukprot:29438-Pelagococcus_subviridis.AAC.6
MRRRGDATPPRARAAAPRRDRPRRRVRRQQRGRHGVSVVPRRDPRARSFGAGARGRECRYLCRSAFQVGRYGARELLVASFPRNFISAAVDRRPR